MTAVAKVTNNCNLRCDHCPWWRRDIEDASTEEWKRILKIVRDQGVIHLVLEGGEPTTRDDIDELISYAKELGMLVMLITNGLRDLKRHHPDSYWISIEGVGDTHDKNRGRGVFDKIVKNIKNNRDANIIVGATINRYNMDQVEEIASFFSPITDGVWFNFMYPYKKAHDIALNPSEQRVIARKIIQLKEENNIISSESYLRSVGMENKNCPSFLTTVIDADTTIRQGCTVEQIEECRCDVCSLGCYGELTQAMKLRLDAIEFLKKTAGLSSHRLLWLR